MFMKMDRAQSRNMPWKGCIYFRNFTQFCRQGMHTGLFGTGLLKQSMERVETYLLIWH